MMFEIPDSCSIISSTSVSVMWDTSRSLVFLVSAIWIKRHGKLKHMESQIMSIPYPLTYWSIYFTDLYWSQVGQKSTWNRRKRTLPDKRNNSKKSNLVKNFFGFTYWVPVSLHENSSALVCVNDSSLTCQDLHDSFHWQINLVQLFFRYFNSCFDYHLKQRSINTSTCNGKTSRRQVERLTTTTSYTECDPDLDMVFRCTPR